MPEDPLKHLFPEKEKPSAPRYLLVILILLFTSIYMVSQNVIGLVIPPTCGIGDRLQNWTAPINRYLGTHEGSANILIILYSLVGDVVILFLIFRSIWGSTIRPMLPLLVFLVLRQTMQILISFPVAPGLIWHDPGIPSAFAVYDISSDFYFSAYVGINILGNFELARLKINWLRVLGLVFVFVEAFIDIVLRSHYTADIYTSVITAIFAYLFCQRFVPPIDEFLKKIKRISPYLLALLIGVGIAVFFIVQFFIGKKPTPICNINDALHNLFLVINQYIVENKNVANILLIAMNSLLDILSVFLVVLTVVTRNVRPFLTLIFFFTLRQSLQMLVSLPLPPHTIWHYPGFPSLLQTYHVSNDLYFSGHTGVSLIAALEMVHFKKRWLTILGLTCFVYEVASVIIMQDHYTMDVYTAIITVFCITGISSHLAPYINQWMSKFKNPFWKA